MIHVTKRIGKVLISLLVSVAVACAQTQRQALTLSIQGYDGEAPLVQLQGRALVDVQDLARVTNASLSFDKDRIILTIPRSDPSKPVGENAGKPGFSSGFNRAAIEAAGSIREWGGMLMITVQYGYPVGNTMAGNTIMAYEGRAADRVALASSAASNDADYRGLELLKNELNHVQAWAERFIKDRNSLRAANLTVSETALKDDEEIQKLVHCGQFLEHMFANGALQDDEACR